MEQADELILNDLRSLGCPVPADVASLAAFTAPVLIGSLLRCLRLVDKERDYPRQVATTRAHKVNQATLLVKALQELGYADKVSYHNLLYPNERDTRAILSWLVPRVPLKETGVSEASAVWLRRAEEHATALLNARAVWVPPFMLAHRDEGARTRPAHAFRTHALYAPLSPAYAGAAKASVAQRTYVAERQPLLTAQPVHASHVAASVLHFNTSRFLAATEKDAEWNSVGLTSGLSAAQYAARKEARTLKTMGEHIRAALAEAKKRSAADIDAYVNSFAPRMDDSQLSRATKFSKEAGEEKREESEEEIAQRRQREREAAEAELAAIEKEVADMEGEMLVANTEILQMTAALQPERTETLKKDFLELKTTLDLISEPEENMRKLKDFAEKQKEKLLKFADDWERVRAPLVDEYRRLSLAFAGREELMRAKLAEIKAMRAEMKTLQESYQEREGRVKALKEVAQSMPKSEGRAAYTGKILVLVNGVKKQRVEMSKILLDTKAVQKEINAITDTLNRTFAVTEELIYQDVNKDKNKKDPVAAEAYKLVARLNTIFTELTESITKAGQASNAALSLEDKIDKLQQRTTALNVDSLAQDLRGVKEDNAKLIAQYQAAKGSSKKAKK